MELALLVGANPRNVKRGPRVRVHSGKWKIRVDGQKDSTLKLHFSDTSTTVEVQDGTPILLIDPTTVELEFTKQGNESSISVFAELT